MIKRRLRDLCGSARREGSLTDGSRVFAAAVGGEDGSGCAGASHTHTHARARLKSYLPQLDLRRYRCSQGGRVLRRRLLIKPDIYSGKSGKVTQRRRRNEGADLYLRLSR